MMLKNLIWQEFQTALVAAMFALLIWIWAEGQNIKAHDLTMDVYLGGAAGRPLVIQPSGPFQLKMKVRCATAQWAGIEKLQEKGLVLEVDPSPYEQVVDFRERLRIHPQFGGRGVQITELSAENPSPRIWVESKVSVSMPVVVVSKDVELASQPTVRPETVQVWVAASRAKMLEGMRVEARLVGLDPKLPEGVMQEARIGLVLPEKVEMGQVQIEPADAQVSFAIRRRTAVLAVDVVTVWTVLRETTRFGVELNPEDSRLGPVELEGPSDVIERLKRGEEKLNLRADLVLDSDELDRGISQKRPEIVNLPAGVTVRSPMPMVRFKVIRKMEGAGAETSSRLMPRTMTVESGNIQEDKRIRSVGAEEVKETDRSSRPLTLP